MGRGRKERPTHQPYTVWTSCGLTWCSLPTAHLPNYSVYVKKMASRNCSRVAPPHSWSFSWLLCSILTKLGLPEDPTERGPPATREVECLVGRPCYTWTATFWEQLLYTEEEFLIGYYYIRKWQLGVWSSSCLNYVIRTTHLVHWYISSI